MFGFGNQVRLHGEGPTWNVPPLDKIATHGDGGKAYTTEGMWHKTMGKENMGCIWGIVISQVDLESQWEAVRNETKIRKHHTKQTKIKKTEVMWNRLVSWTKGKMREETVKD